MAEFRIEINASGGVPERLLLVPAGQFTGRDGRVFYNDSPVGVLSAFRADRRHIPIDVDHELELTKQGSAKGWITELAEERGAIYGRVEWNNTGSWLIENRSFRYISPVFYVDEKRNILKVESVALTNKPNLYFKSLNTEGRKEEEDMTGVLAKELCTALGVPEDSSVADAVAKIVQLQQGAVAKIARLQPGAAAANTSTVMVPKADYEGAMNRAETAEQQLKMNAAAANMSTVMVPKADYEGAMNRAETAEQQLKVNAAAALQTEANSAIDTAVSKGTIAPASKQYYLEQCSTAEGLAKFKEFARTAPKVIPGTASVPAGGKEPNSSDLNSEEKELCAQMGVSEEAFALGKQ